MKLNILQRLFCRALGLSDLIDRVGASPTLPELLEAVELAPFPDDPRAAARLARNPDTGLQSRQ